MSLHHWVTDLEDEARGSVIEWELGLLDLPIYLLILLAYDQNCKLKNTDS